VSILKKTVVESTFDVNHEVEISVVLPIFNEERHIKSSLKTIAFQLSKATNSFEIIAVDDGSQDDTWAQLTTSARDQPYLKCFKLSRNFGKEFALCAGLERTRGKAVIVMDSDLQHPPYLIPEMIERWRHSNVVIVECRKKSRGSESLFKKAGSRIFYTIINKLTGFELKDATDFKLIDRKVVEAWRSMPEQQTFFRGMTAWLGFDKVIIEFDTAERVAGNSKWSLVSLLKLAINAVVSFSSLPLRIVTIFGGIFFLFSVVLGIQTLYLKISDQSVTGFTTTILLLLITGSLILLSLGIIGEYIAAIYNEVKERPRYVLSNFIDKSSVSHQEIHSEEKSKSFVAY
jgi:polyisoprenyl-phosphate glycosyltransferase